MDEFGYGNIEDWCNFCDGKLSHKERDSLDFSFLFSDFNDEDFKVVLSYFPQSEDLHTRLNRHRNFDAENSPEIMTLVSKELNNMRAICELVGNHEIVGKLSNRTALSPITTDEYQSLWRDQTLLTFMTSLHEYAIKFYRNQSPNFWDVFDAYYMFTGNNFRLAYFLTAPLLQKSNLFSSYLDIWHQGYDYVVTDKGVKVLKRPVAGI